MITFVRRRGLGYSSCKGMAEYLNSVSIPARVWSTYQPAFEPCDDEVFIRWGCTSTIPKRNQTIILNKANAIHTVSNKALFSLKMKDVDVSLQPVSYYSSDDLDVVSARVSQDTDEWVLRPSYHSQGRDLKVVTRDTFHTCITMPPYRDGWYLRKLVNKTAEYRVHIVGGYIVSVESKTPANNGDIAWNMAQGGTCQVLRWSQWPIEVCRKAIIAFNLSKLDFSGVDIMVSDEGVHVVEVNSAPSVPHLSDGSLSYNQKGMAKAFAWHYKQQCYTDDMVPADLNGTSWKDYIHPAIYD